MLLRLGIRAFRGELTDPGDQADDAHGPWGPGRTTQGQPEPARTTQNQPEPIRPHRTSQNHPDPASISLSCLGHSTWLHDDDHDVAADDDNDHDHGEDGDSDHDEHLWAYCSHRRCDKRILTWHVNDDPVQQTHKRVDTSLLGLGIRAFRRELTSISVGLFLGPNLHVSIHAEALHRCASGANASFAPGRQFG